MTVTAGFVSIDTFLPEILQYVNGAPSIMARIHVVNTIINFCERTFILKKTASEISLEASKHTYELAFCNDRYVAINIEDVRVGDDETALPLTSTTEKEMTEENPNWRYTEGTEPTRVWLTDTVNGIRFWETPNDDIDDPVTIICAVRPKRAETEFDEVIYEKWNEAITAGAVAELCLIPGASWFNPTVATIYELKYKRWIARARKTTINAPGQYPGRVTPQSFGNIGGDNGRITTWV